MDEGKAGELKLSWLTISLALTTSAFPEGFLQFYLIADRTTHAVSFVGPKPNAML